MIYVATLIDVLLRFGCRKSGGVIHDKTEISSFHLIILDVQSRWQWMSKLSSGGPSSTGRQKQIYRAWVILCITLIAFLSLARSLHSSHFKLIFNLGQQLVFKKILKGEGNGDSMKWLIDVWMVVLWCVSIPLGYFFFFLEEIEESFLIAASRAHVLGLKMQMRQYQFEWDM